MPTKVKGGMSVKMWALWLCDNLLNVWKHSKWIELKGRIWYYYNSVISNDWPLFQNCNLTRKTWCLSHYHILQKSEQLFCQHCRFFYSANSIRKKYFFMILKGPVALMFWDYFHMFWMGKMKWSQTKDFWLHKRDKAFQNFLNQKVYN
jgi:hypothetical protein